MARLTQAGRGWAYTGIICGGAVSIAANVAHSFLPPNDASTHWTPEPGAVVGAIVWPVFLFIAVEILVRTVWPRGWSWGLLRFAGLLPVAGVAAFVSYRHLSGLLAHYGEEPIVQVIGPLAVDGLMIMATAALYAGKFIAHNVSHPAAAPPAAMPTAPVPTPPAVPPPSGAPVEAAAPATTGIPTPDQVKARVQQRPPTVWPKASSAASGTDTPVTAHDAAPTAPMASPAQLARARALAETHLKTTGSAITAGELAVRMRIDSGRANNLLTVLNEAQLTSTAR